MTTSPELAALVSDLRTMIQSDESADPAARAIGVIVLELASVLISDLHRVADAVEKIATPEQLAAPINITTRDDVE